MIRVATMLLVIAACSSHRGNEPAPVPARPGVVAHRGASREAPENTIAAVDLAYEQGADGVEIDVWRAKDGRIVVFHDKTTERYGGSSLPVSEQTFEELRALDVGDGQRIPSLEEVLARIPKGRILFIEVKSEADTVEAIAEVVIANDPATRGARVGFQGFSLEVMTAVRKRFPDAPIHWLIGAKRDDATRRILPIDPGVVDRAAAAKMTGLAIDYRGSSPELARAMDKAGLELYLWTLDSPEDVRLARDRGAVWIETNLPAMAVGALR